MCTIYKGFLMHDYQWVGLEFIQNMFAHCTYLITSCECKKIISASRKLSSALMWSCVNNLIVHDIWPKTSFFFCSFFPPISVAGLRRSFRLSRKDRQGSSGEGSDPGDPEFLTYEEVTRYQQRPHERPRLVVLIGETEALKGTNVQ